MSRKILSRALSRDDLSEGTIVWLPNDTLSQPIRCISSPDQDDRDGFIQEGGRNHPVVIIYRSSHSHHTGEVAFVLVRSFGGKSLEYWKMYNSRREDMENSIPIIQDFDSQGHGNTAHGLHLEDRKGRLNIQSYVRYDKVYIAQFHQLRAWAPAAGGNSPESLRLDRRSRVWLLNQAVLHSPNLKEVMEQCATHHPHPVAESPPPEMIFELEAESPSELVVPGHHLTPSTEVFTRGYVPYSTRPDPNPYVAFNHVGYGTIQPQPALLPEESLERAGRQTKNGASRFPRCIVTAASLLLLIGTFAWSWQECTWDDNFLSWDGSFLSCW